MDKWYFFGMVAGLEDTEWPSGAPKRTIAMPRAWICRPRRPSCLRLRRVRSRPPALSTQAFYDDCRDALAPGGVYAGNLYATDQRLHLARLARSFDACMVRLQPPGQPNLVVLAWRPHGPGWPRSGDALAALPERARLQLQVAFEAVDAALAPFCECDC